MSIQPTRILLVRHGATVLSAEDRFAGESDVELSDIGRAQARCLGVRLSSDVIAGFYASHLSRARETAAILAAPHEREVQIRPELREISHGRWEQRTRVEVEQDWPEEYARWEVDPFAFAPVGGETGLAVTARALPVLLAIVEAHAGETAVIVSHKATIRLLLSNLLGVDPRRYRDRLDQSPASLNVLDFRGPSRARLTLYNDTSHYAAPLPEVPHDRLSRWWGPVR